MTGMGHHAQQRGALGHSSEVRPGGGAGGVGQGWQQAQREGSPYLLPVSTCCKIQLHCFVTERRAHFTAQPPPASCCLAQAGSNASPGREPRGAPGPCPTVPATFSLDIAAQRNGTDAGKSVYGLCWLGRKGQHLAGGCGWQQDHS